MKTVKIEEATQAQLYRFATVHLGLPGIQPNTGEAKLREKIRTATNEDTIVVQESAEGDKEIEARTVEKQRPSPRGKKPPVINPLNFAIKDPRFLITIAADKTKSGKQPVFVACNGNGMLLPRQKKIEVPARYFYVMQNAVQNVVEDDEDGNRSETESPAYNYTVHREPSQDELDDWHDLMEELSGGKARAAA